MTASILIEPKELRDNNLRILKLRKMENKRSLTRYFELLGYIFIIILYFKNISFIRFILRLLLHQVLANPFPKQSNMQLEQNVKRQLTKSFFYTLMLFNGLFLFLDLVVGVPTNQTNDSFFNGSITLQIIGETKPTTRYVYIYYNALIFGCQFITLYLSSMIDINAEVENQNSILPGSTYSLNEVEGDGYSGRTTVAHIHPMQIYNEVTSYELSEESPDHYHDYMGNRLNMGSMI